MREILFRGQRTDNNNWTKGYLFCIWEKAYILWGTTNGIPNMIEVIPETVGQYTGWEDKNGKKIFEGDIIEGGYLNPLTNKFNSKKYVVEFKHATFIGKLIGHSPYGDTWLYFVHGDIIGNIHDNPKLLER